MTYATTRTYSDIPDTTAPTVPVSYTAETYQNELGWLPVWARVEIPRAPRVPRLEEK